jgi:hypothetical protein
VLVGDGVGEGVWVGVGVFVGTGVFVGVAISSGVLVGSGVEVGSGIDVSVNAMVGSSDDATRSSDLLDPAQATNIALRITRIVKRNLISHPHERLRETM